MFLLVNDIKVRNINIVVLVLVFGKLFVFKIFLLMK